MVSIVGSGSSVKENKKSFLISCLRRRRGPLYWLLVAVGLVSLWRGTSEWIHHKIVDAQVPATPSPAPVPPVDLKDWVQFEIDYKERNNNRQLPPGMKQWLAYAKANKCNEREFYQSLEDDLKFFRDVIAKEGRKFRQEEIVRHGLQQTDNYMAFTLRQHQLQVVASYNYGGNYVQQKDIEEKLRWILEPIRVHTPAINATYFFNLHDGATPAKNTTNRPLFSVCKQSYWTDDNLIPTPDDRKGLLQDLQQEVVSSDKAAWQHIAEEHHQDFNDWAAFASHDILVPYHFGFDTSIPPNENWLKFVNRKDTIVWRGSTTGSVWGQSPRFRLIAEYGGTEPHALSETSPNVQVDFAFVDVLQQGQKGKTLAPGSRAGSQHRMNFQQLQEHKYIMDVDGNAFTSRFPGLLRSGSLIFKSTRYKEWYTERLVPFVDYIPVNYNLTDLVEKVEWAHQNFDLTEKMVQHAQTIADHYLRREDMRCYVYRLLLEYQTLFEN